MCKINLCDYKDIFGNPYEGLHSYRVFDIAIIDVLLVLITVYLYTSYTGQSFFECLIVAFVIGIILHRIFCVRTYIDRLLFPDIDYKNN